MIVVTVELWSAITKKRTRLGQMMIHNIGGTKTSGNYRAVQYRKNCGVEKDLNKGIVRTGEIHNHPRLRNSVWNLVWKALNRLNHDHP